MQGKRTYKSPHLLEPGEYCLWEGEWYGQTPNDLLSGLAKHKVVEHEDGTITVSPSILTWGGKDDPKWHGYLEAGVWREC
jgi:hypothetical protein